MPITEQEGLDLGALESGSPVPLYYQVFESLSRKIHSGEIPNGYMLPSETGLAQQLGVSRITIKRAFNELAATGLVSRKRGSGTQVTLNTALMVKGGIMDMTANIAAIRQRTKAKLLERRQTEIPENVYNMLKLSPNDAVEMTAHTLLMNENAVTLSLTYAPAKFFEKFTDADIERKSLITLMHKENTRVVKADQTLSAIAATPYHADIFSIKIGAPLLEIQCLMFDQRSVPCQFVITYFQPEFYRYEMTLT